MKASFDRAIVVLIMSDVISAFGDGITAIAMLTLAYNLTSSAEYVALVTILYSLGSITAPFFLSYLKRNFNVKYLLIALDVSRSIVILLGIIIHSIWILFGLISLMSILTGIYYPLRLSAYQHLANSTNRVSVISLQQSLLNLASVISPFLCTSLIYLGGLPIAFCMDSLTFLVAAVLIAQLPSWQKSENESTPHLTQLDTIKSGFNLIMTSGVQRSILCLRLTLLSVLSLYQITYIYSLTKLFSNHHISIFSSIDSLFATFSSLSAFSLIVGSLLCSKIQIHKDFIRAFIVGISLIITGCLMWATTLHSEYVQLVVYLSGTVSIYFGLSILRVTLYASGQEITPKEQFVKIVSTSDAISRTWQQGIGAIYLGLLNITTIKILLFTISAISCSGYYHSRKISNSLKSLQKSVG